MDSPKIFHCRILTRMQLYVKDREDPQRFVGGQWDSPNDLSLLLLKENVTIHRKQRESHKICFFCF